MKLSFNAISIGLNIVLLGVFIFWLQPTRHFVNPEPRSKTEPSFTATTVQTERVVDTTSAPVSISNFHWREVESEDYPTYMANLRAIRCPEKTIFDVIFADIEQMFAARKTALERDENPWLPGDDFEKARLEKLEKLIELSQEKRTLIKTLLNSDLDWEVMQSWYEENELGVFAGFLPDGQTEHVLSVAIRFMERIEQVDQRAGGLLIPEDARQKLNLYSEMQTALSNMISAPDWEESELRVVCLMSYFSYLFSDGDLRQSRLTGSELRKIMQVKLRIDNPLKRELAKYDGEDSAPDGLSKQNFLEQAKTVLGEVRYQQFLRGHDRNFDQLCDIVVENGLSPRIATGVYEIRQAALLETSRIREDRTLRRKEQRLEVEAIEQSARAAVERLLGERATASYATNGGRWLKESGKP